MNFVYFKERDTLYLELLPEDPDHVWEAHPGVVINLSKNGRVVGIEIEGASQMTDLSMLKVGNFPGLVETLTGTVKPH